MNLNQLAIKSIYLKARRWIWIAALLAIVGFIAGLIYAGTVHPTPYADTTLITIDTDMSSVFGYQMSYDEVTNSRRIATEFMDIIKSNKVTRLAVRYMNESGHIISDRTLAEMVTLNQVSTGSNILRLRAASSDPDIVVDAANAMATAFVDTLYEYTGSIYVSVLDYAERTSYTAGGNRSTFGAAGAAAGLIAGAIIIYLFVISDYRIKTIDDVSRVDGVGRVAIVPLFSIK